MITASFPCPWCKRYGLPRAAHWTSSRETGQGRRWWCRPCLEGRWWPSVSPRAAWAVTVATSPGASWTASPTTLLVRFVLSPSLWPGAASAPPGGPCASPAPCPLAPRAGGVARRHRGEIWGGGGRAGRGWREISEGRDPGRRGRVPTCFHARAWERSAEPCTDPLCGRHNACVFQAALHHTLSSSLTDAVSLQQAATAQTSKIPCPTQMLLL